MRINEFNSLQEFIDQYDGTRSHGDEFYMGLDFIYKGKQYRVCREPLNNDFFFVYHVRDLGRVNPEYGNEEYDFEILATYQTMEELLKGTCIDSRLFRDVIMDDATEMIGKD